MNFDRLNRANCVVPPEPVADPRCESSEFALANPGLCNNSALILRPSVALICVNDSIKFRVFEYLNGQETELTEGVTFESSNEDVFIVGVNSGTGTSIEGTGLATGTVNVTATYQGRTVTASIEVGEGTGNTCCDNIHVATAIAVDDSRSMTLNFGGGYSTRLAYAKAIAASYGGLILTVDGTPKDSIKPWEFNSDPTALLDAFTGVTTEVTDAIATISQTQQKTDLLDIFTTITDDLLLEDVDRRVVVLITDGEHTNDSNRQAVIDAATTFKDAGGIVIVVGVRASGTGYDLLERIATSGYFLNATPENIEQTLADLNYLKSLTCAGNCIPVGDDYTNAPQLDYVSFLNWQVIQGQVNLIGPGLLDLLPDNGLYVDMASGSKALLRSIDSFALISGRSYRISFSAAGNQRLNIAGQGLKVYLREVSANDADPNIFEQTVFPAWNDDFQDFGFTFPVLFNATVRIYFEQLGTDTDPVAGNLIDNILFQDYSTLTTLLDDNFDSENLSFVIPACGPSSAVVAIEDPAVPTDSDYDAPGSTIRNTDEYHYAVSYLTPEGETDLSPVLTVTTINTPDHGIRVTFATPPANVIAVRIWRNITDGGSDLWLLATLNPLHYTAHDDDENHAEFADRADFSIMAPTSNTTGKAEGELGLGYADCCYYFTEIVDNNDLVSVIPAMTSTTEPSGIVTTNSTDPVANEFYAFDDNSETLYRGFGGVVGAFDMTYNTPVWLSYQFPAPVTIKRYSITVPDPIPGPNTWQFKGSNDGSSWTTLDTQTAITTWDADVPNVYNIGSPAAYLYYRLYCTVAQDSAGAGPDGLGNYGAWHYIGELKMFISTTNIVTEYVNNCPECSDQPPGQQAQDPNPLPDIESDFTPPTTYSSTKNVCATCGAGQLNLPAEPLPWTIVTHSSIGGSIVDIVQLNDGAAKLKAFKLDLTGKVFNTPVSITLAGSDSALGTYTTIASVVAGFYLPGVVMLPVPDDVAAYEFYSIGFNSFVSDQASPILSADSFFGVAASQSVCATATETSTVSQSDADAKATAAALALATAGLNCVPVFVATETAKAVCPVGSYGNEVTKSATRISFTSQADAIQLAQAAAQADANSSLDCTLSNNDQQIAINDTAKATPYPSVSYKSGLGTTITKVVVTLTGLSHPSPDDIIMLLVAPDGVTNCLLMANCGGAAPQGISGVNLVLDQTAGSFLPDSTQIVSGTFKPKAYGSVGGPGLLPVPAPQPVTYGALLTVFNGLNPNGAWSLWIVDDLSIYAGTLDSWSLTITAT